MITFPTTTTKRNARMLRIWRQQIQRKSVIRDLVATAKILVLITLGAVLAIVGLI